jgi:hypothetical protein
MRKLINHKSAQIGMVGAAVGLLITLIIAVLIYYNVAPSGTLPNPGGNGTMYKTQIYNASKNATTNINSQAATFFIIAPITAVVIVAVVIINYVQKISG